MFNDLIDNNEFFVVHRIEKINFVRISAIVIFNFVVNWRRRRFLRFWRLKKIKKFENCLIILNCSMNHSFQQIQLCLIKIVVVDYVYVEQRWIREIIDELTNVALINVELNKLLLIMIN